MRPSEKKTTTESIELFKQSLEGNNYSRESIKAYLSDLAQFVEWLKSRRVDFDIPFRIARIDIVEWLLLDSRVVDVPMAFNPTFVMLSALKPLFFNSLKNEYCFLDNGGA